MGSGAVPSPFGLANPFAMPGMGMPPPEVMQQMLQIPAVQQSMRELAANPEQMRALSAMHPMSTNPAFRAHMDMLLQNPAMLQQMMDPANIQAMMQLQSMMGGMGGAGAPAMGGFPGMGGAVPGGGGSAPGSSVGGSGLGAGMGAGVGAGGMPGLWGAPGAFPFMGMGGFPPAAAPAQPAQPPAVRFATQLQQLRDMGFYDEAENIQVLEQVHGNVSAAIERLLQR